MSTVWNYFDARGIILKKDLCESAAFLKVSFYLRVHISMTFVVA